MNVKPKWLGKFPWKGNLTILTLKKKNFNLIITIKMFYHKFKIYPQQTHTLIKWPEKKILKVSC